MVLRAFQDGIRGCGTFSLEIRWIWLIQSGIGRPGSKGRAIGFTDGFTRFGGSRRCDMYALLLTVSLVLLFIVLVWLVSE